MGLHFYVFTKKLNTNTSMLKFSVVYLKEWSSTKGSVAYIDNWVRLKKVRMLPICLQKGGSFCEEFHFLIDWVQLKKVRTNFFQCFGLREPTCLNTVFISQLWSLLITPKISLKIFTKQTHTAWKVETVISTMRNRKTLFEYSIGGRICAWQKQAN